MRWRIYRQDVPIGDYVEAFDEQAPRFWLTQREGDSVAEWEAYDADDDGASCQVEYENGVELDGHPADWFMVMLGTDSMDGVAYVCTPHLLSSIDGWDTTRLTDGVEAVNVEARDWLDAEWECGTNGQDYRRFRWGNTVQIATRRCTQRLTHPGDKHRG